MESGCRPSSTSIEYEVFLSFRGPDTRKTFTDCLYEAMTGAGIRVYRDEDELQVGRKIKEELPRAIESSRIYIPILSRNYASSHWCMRELAYMVRSTSRSDGKKEILPIFFDVKSDDIKLKTPLYRDALLMHRERFVAEEVAGWQQALKEIDQLKRWNVQNSEGHGKLIRVVVQDVLIKLNNGYKNLTEHLVEDPVQIDDILNLLDIDSGGVRVVGLHGTGGIGKTTIAKVIFNKLSSHFDRCSFLENVRETSRRDGLVCLQKQLLSCILGSRFTRDIYNADHGASMIKKGLCNKKVLIILDDLDEKEQLEKLVGKWDWFESGSRIIVTTRDTSVLMDEVETLDYATLNQSKTCFAHEVKEMNFDQALQLFSRHAFRRDSPPKEYDDLSRQIVSTLGKLPLAVEVIGSSLSYGCRDRAVWEETLKKLQKVPPKKVQETLLISYERLDQTQRQVFLDIAFFFVKEDKSYPIFMWSDCEYYPHDAIRVLLLRSLLKIGKDKKFWMHDQVRDLGRHIIYEENCKFPGKHSRVRIQEDSSKILRIKEGNEHIQALSLSFSGCTFTSKELASLRNLRFLRGTGLNFQGDFKDLLSKLRWLSWHACPPNFAATNFCPFNLVVLDLSRSDITEDWAGWSQVKMAKKLKVLDLRNCKCLRRTPDFSDFASLEMLILAWCSKLISIDRSISQLRCLKTLNMDGCDSLQELPEEIGSLESLEEFIMPRSSQLSKIPGTIGNLKSLSSLTIYGHKEISELPHSLGGLAKVARLSITWCSGISDLPSSLGELESLIELDLSFTGVAKLPNSVGNLKKLRVIRMVNAKITELPAAIGQVEMLEELHCRDCRLLKGEIPSEIGKLSHLRILDFSCTSISGLPKTIGHLSHLKQLELKECHELQQVPELPSSLESLSLDAYHCRIIPDLSNIVTLVHLDISFHPGPQKGSSKSEEHLSPWKNDKSISQLPSCLSTLRLTRCALLPRFSKFKNLSSLHILSCSKVLYLPTPEGLEMLMELSVVQCESLMKIHNLSSAKNLRTLYVSELQSLTEIQGLGELELLECLRIIYCDSIKRLPNLSKLGKLEYLELEYCPNLRVIEGLSCLQSLKHATITDCTSLERLPDLPESTKLDTDWKSPA